MPNGTLMQVAFHFGKTKVREMAADMRAFLRTSSHKRNGSTRRMVAAGSSVQSD
jgi:hypothetical protein